MQHSATRIICIILNSFLSTWQVMFYANIPYASCAS